MGFEDFGQVSGKKIKDGDVLVNGENIAKQETGTKYGDVLVNGESILKQEVLQKDKTVEQSEAEFKKAVSEKIGIPENKFKIITSKNMEYPKTPETWMQTLKERNTDIPDGTEDMLNNMENSTLPKNQKFIKLTVEDLFNDINSHTYEEICNKAKFLGLELCAQDDCPKLLLLNEKALGDWYTTVMEPIRIGSVFRASGVLSAGGYDSLRIWQFLRFTNGKNQLLWGSGNAGEKKLSVHHLVFRFSK